MARSYKKNPAGGITTARSEKEDKRHTNRAIRRISKIRIGQDQEPISDPDEHRTIWSFAKDGKQRYSPEMVQRWPKLLRK